MSKEIIDDSILTFTIPYMPMIDVGGNNRTVSPDDDIVKRCVDYFEKHFKNADQFYLAEVENDRWVYFEDTKDWVNLGNNVKMKRKSAPNEQMIERNEG